ncbi:hypothetical protein CMI46_02840 [Candidatus Pacearchaeota archaeon]|nr:hypothetical protein [Candidatus Pacearchaeota archaeon]|tara:strand:- start:543 stop:2228 length:1686 start_codon:yes stop_codon:yes gene_type:complete
MKVFSILVKNIRNVSRNKGYFVVLFLFPALLILFASIMFSSFSLENVGIGVVDHGGGYEFNVEKISRFINYNDIEGCLDDLPSGIVNLCIVIDKINQSTHLEVYLDNSNRYVQSYTKETFLEASLNNQLQDVGESSELISERLSLYSLSISNARSELVNIGSELDEQEKLLVDYKKNLTRLREDFDEAYFAFKEVEPQIRVIQEQLNGSDNSLESDISSFRQRKNYLVSQIEVLKVMLAVQLPLAQYQEFDDLLTSIVDDLENIDRNLQNIESVMAGNEIEDVVNSFDGIVVKIENIRTLLYQADEDIDNSISKIQESKLKIQEFDLALEEAERDLTGLMGEIKDGDTSISFKNSFEFFDDPTFLIFPLLISLIITLSSLVLSNLFILRQVNKPSYFREIITPTSQISFIFADYIINLFFISIQIVVLFLIGLTWFEFPLHSFYLFFLVCFVVSSIFIFIGMSFGYLIESQNLSMLTTVFLTMLMLIFSDLLIYSDLTGKFVKFFIDLNPFVILHSSLKNVIVFNKDFFYLVPSLIVLFVMYVISFLVTYLSRAINFARLE